MATSVTGQRRSGGARALLLAVLVAGALLLLSYAADVSAAPLRTDGPSAAAEPSSPSGGRAPDDDGPGTAAPVGPPTSGVTTPAAPTPGTTGSGTATSAPPAPGPDVTPGSGAPASTTPVDVAPGRTGTAPAVGDSRIPTGSVLLALAVLLGAAGLLRRALRPAAAPPGAALPDRTPRPGTGDPAAVLALLLVLGEALVDAGDALRHVQAVLREVADAQGVGGAAVVVLPTALFVSVPAPDGVGVVNDVTAAGSAPLRLDQADALFRVVDDARRGALTPEQGVAAVLRVRAFPAPFSPGARVVGHMLFSVGLALLLRGTALDVTVAASLGMLVGALHLLAARWARDVQALLPVLAALAVSVAVFGVGRAAPELSVLPSLVAPLVVLLPGALLTTAVLELSTGDIVSGAGRLAAGGLRLVLLALGILAGGQLVGVPASGIAEPPDDAVGVVLPWLGVSVFAVGVVLFVGARRSSLPWILLVLHVAYAGQVVGGLVFGAALSAFFGALAMTPVAVVAARAESGPPALVSFSPAFWLLVPGAVGLEGVTRFLDDDRVEGISSLVTMGTSLVGVALGVLLGLAVGSAVSRRLPTARPAAAQR